MKKRNLLLMLLLAIGLPWAANAQKAIPYSYGFEDNNLATDGWTQQTSNSSSGIFSASSSSYEGTYLFRFNYNENPGYLISPLLTGTNNGVDLEFYYANYSSSYNEKFQVGYTTDENVTDPSAFTYLSEITCQTLAPSYTKYENTFPAGTKRIAIKYIYTNGYYLYLDDFSFKVPASCPKPTDLVCTAYTANTATLSWTENGTATNWVIEYADNANFTGAQTANASGTPSKQLTGLTAEKTYYARVKAICDEDSDWSNTCEFKPSAAVCDQIGTGTSTAYLVYTSYGCTYSQHIYTAAELTDMGFTAGDIVSVSFYYSGASSTYDKTQSIYMGTTTKSSYSGSSASDFESDVTLVYGPTLLSYVAGWREYELTEPFTWDGASNIVVGMLTNSTQSTSSGWSTYGTSTSPDYRTVYRYRDSTPIDITNLAAVSNGSRSTTRPNINLCILTSATPKPRNLTVSATTSDGATLTWDAPANATPLGYYYHYKKATDAYFNQPIDNGLNTSVTLTGLDPNTEYMFGVYANYTAGAGDYAEITFTTDATCMPVTNITVSDITSTGAKLAWDDPNGATSWQYLTVAHGDTPDWTSNLVNTSNTHANVPANILAGTGQQPQPNTEYDFYVRANCGGGDYSEAAMLTFRTACGAITSLPWTEDFNSYSTTATSSPAPSSYPNDVMPDCWTFLNRSESTSTYPQAFLTSYLDYAVSGNCLFFKSSSNTPLYAVLPEFGTDIAGLEISFTYRNEGTGTSNGTLYVGYMTDPNDASTFNTENAVACDQTTSKTPMNVVLPNAPAGSYFAFKYQGGTSNNYYLAIDNITVKVPVFVTANQIVNTVSDPATEMTWNEFAQHVNNGDHFTSSTFTLMDNITVSTMVGSSDKPFTGTFNGNSHTITVNLTATDNNFTAPFRVIKNATIQNLKVDGTINDGGFKFCAGFAGDCYGNNTFTNCESAVTINATIEGDGTHGGFIARNYGGSSSSSSSLATTVFNGCAFTGQLLGASTTQSAGFCGWSEYSSPNYAKTIFNNCLFAPQEVTMGTTNSATFARYRSATYVNFNNCYFMQDFNDGTNNTAQGKQAYTIAGVDPVYVDFSGEHTLYNMSGIDAYTEGMKHGYTKLAGEGDDVTLTLDGAAGYEADHGTLVANGETFTLTMEAYDTHISGVSCPVPYNVAVPAANLTASSAQVTWNGGSDSYTIMYGEVVDDVTTYDFEDQTIPANFTNDATYPWVIASSGHGGSYSIKSGNGQGGHNSTTSEVIYELTLASESTLSFWAKISSESTYDKGYFSIDGSNKINGISGAGSWIEYSYPLAAGTHTLRWYYTKDISTDSNDDCFYVDDITITSSAVETWTTLSNITASPYTIDNLTPETTYQVKVSGTCSNVETDFSDVIEFTTLATCPAPTELAVTEGSVTAHEATITWTENGEATTWIVEYADNADFSGALTETVEDNATYSFDELDGETTYYVRVKAHCGEEDESDYSNVVNFTTLVACQAPTVLTVTATTTTTATLSWTENGTATAWQICLNGDETNLIAANSNPFTLESLTAATSYTVKVRANCGGIDGESGWSNTVNFTTDCGVITTFPWSENFNSLGMANSIPNCWDNSEGTTTSDAHKWSYQGGDYLRFNSWSNTSGNTNFLKTPVLSLPNSPMQLSFRYKNPTGGDFSVYISTDGGATYTTSLFTGLTDQSDWEQKTYDLTAYAGQQNVVIVFGGTSNYGSGDAYLYLDDVEISYFFTKTIEAVGDEGWAEGKGGYYLIASPLADDVDPTTVGGMITADEGDVHTYDLYSFDQEEDLEWQNYRAGAFNLVNGQGYLYASKNGTTLTFTGAPSTNGEVTLDLKGSGSWTGWNLVGNPFGQTAYLSRAFYSMQNAGDFTANTEGGSIGMLEGVFVIATEDGETLTFTTTAPGKVSQLNLNLTKGNSLMDRAIVRFDEGQQLPKLQFREGSTKVYIPMEGKDYAVVAAENNVGEMPVSFKAEKNGSYTLSFTNEEVTFSYLHLIDNMTGNDVNLLETPNYTFDARTSDYESRFKLVFAVGSSATDDTFGFVNASGNFCIFGIEGEATVQVIDMLGHVISSETFSGSYERKINGAPGVYLVRLINGNDVKVQKVVVR